MIVLRLPEELNGKLMGVDLMAVSLMVVSLMAVSLMGVALIDVHLMGVDLMDVHLMGAVLMVVSLIGVSLIGLALMDVRLIGLALMGVPLMSVSVTICHIGTPLVNLTGCEIRFVLFGPDGRVTEWSLTPCQHHHLIYRHRWYTPFIWIGAAVFVVGSGMLYTLNLLLRRDVDRLPNSRWYRRRSLRPDTVYCHPSCAQ